MNDIFCNCITSTQPNSYGFFFKLIAYDSYEQEEWNNNCAIYHEIALKKNCENLKTHFFECEMCFKNKS